ncbi:MAG TPA: family 20 glycosylhydrolase [Verrucomicrobiae bacterium]|nr:family 20 glycosylhydrolase [Verrucomicrobiae bacterium]
MKMRIVFPAALVLAVTSMPAATLGLIPQPVSVETHAGVFHVTARTEIVVPAGAAEVRQTAEYLVNALAPATGWKLKVMESPRPAARRNAIVLAIAAQNAATGHAEGYELTVTPRGARIEAATPAGLFYGVQTLLQLLPPEIESSSRQNAAWTAPSVHIVDYPQFAWRGLMLDVSRHFFPKAFVEQYIDRMARYKMNVFHWHLTDDNGWRIEIKSLPQLTKVGAWRVPRMGKWGSREAPQDGEAATDGGFYTQDDIREVLAFAKQRYVTVLPEIEMPGHSLAALAAYPELSCTGGPFHVDPGSNFYQKVDNAFCPGNEKTFEFIDKVFTEVAALFPSQFVHIGGDECYKGFWKTCPKCQRRMADEHLANVEELQSYLVKRAEKILESKGKKLIGWDEILEGGLAPNAAVMSWRGMEGGIAAAKMNHQVVMTPTNFVYLDYYQGDPTLEPSTFGRLLLSTCYRFNLTPEGVDPKYIIGGQGNLWTESVPTPRHAEYMTWPRSFALAEDFWSPAASRNWDDFTTRVEAQFKRLDAAQVDYARTMYDVSITPVRDTAGKLAVRLATELDGDDIYYTLDGTNPDPFTLKYSGEPVTIPGDAWIVRAIAYRGGQPSGRLLSLTVKDLTARLDRR